MQSASSPDQTQQRNLSSHNAQPSSSSSSSPSGQQSSSPQHIAKLDGVLYHFYSTTATIVTQARLTHVGQASSLPNAPKQDQRISKWFALQLKDQDFFREELRYWRSISSILAHSSANGGVAFVPPLVLDIILDTSAIQPEHSLMLSFRQPGEASGSNSPLAASAKTTTDGRYTFPSVHLASGPKESILRGGGDESDLSSKPIVLERWKLEFHPAPTRSAPELPTLYKRSISHFRALFTIANSLPVHRLRSRIDAARSRAEARASRALRKSEAIRSHAEGSQSQTVRKDSGSQDDAAIASQVPVALGDLDSELRIGCRLGMQDEPDRAVGEVGIDEVLEAEKIVMKDEEARQSQESLVSNQASKSQSINSHLVTRKLAPLITSLGTLHFTVTYRKYVDYSVEDLESLKSVRDMQIELEEDYFRPTVEMVRRRTGSGVERKSSISVEASSPAQRVSQASPGSPQSPGHSPTYGGAIGLGASSSPTTIPTQLPTVPERPKSLLSATAAHNRVGGLTAARLSGQGSASANPNVSTTSTAPLAIPPSEQLLSRSPGTPSVFSTSAPGRPVAGLSSLRRTGSISGNLSNNGSSLGLTGAATPSSPALAAALSTEPAFLAHGPGRRTSASERKLRSFSGLSSDNSSPPSPLIGSYGQSLTAGASPIGSSVRQPTSVRQSNLSAQAPGASFRTGSFSPSSPSPLAQQMSLQYPTNLSTTSASRLSVSPGMRSITGSPGLSLRNVFQSYAPQSPSSLSSYSRTPPTSITMTSAQGASGSIRIKGEASEVGRGGTGASLSIEGNPRTGAQPQMIKRYSTTFSYRSGRERRGFSGSLGAEGGIGGSSIDSMEPSSLPGSAGGSLGVGSSRSWAIRMEQRQQGMYGRSLGREETVGSGQGGSLSSRLRASASGGATPEGLTPSPTSQEDDIDDLVRLIDSRPLLRGANEAGSIQTGLGQSPMTHHEAARNGFNLCALQSTGARAVSIRENHPGAQASARNRVLSTGSYSSGNVSPSTRTTGLNVIRPANPLSRSQVDEMLNKLAMSVNQISPGTTSISSSIGGGGGAGGGAATGSQSNSNSPYYGSPRNAPTEISGSLPPSYSTRPRPSLRGAFEVTGSGGGIGVGSGGFRAGPNFHSVRTAPDDHSASIGRGHAGASQARGLSTSANTPPNAAQVSPKDVNVVDGILEGFEGGLGTSGHPTGDALGLVRGRPAAVDVKGGGAEDGLSSSSSRRDRDGRRSPTEFDRTEPSSSSYSNTYDPADDETAGRMELLTGDLFEDDYTPNDERAPLAPGNPGVNTNPTATMAGQALHHPHLHFGENRNGGGGGGSSSGSSSRRSTLPGVGVAPGCATGLIERTSCSTSRERERERERERRRADAELVRNFGQDLASTRGRGGRSPWRREGGVVNVNTNPTSGGAGGTAGNQTSSNVNSPLSRSICSNLDD
ncbi:hypothetical protein IE53DRAFT_362070 [Violaceomyces palustris]|uniref:Uncharacterized protein n=1 Tax=Violaceomyces palustris TaxID=1673888 RepID=A0ACD0NYK2_9BASI|nr:hypothetical protein IE53DRAFT_362070 [Violaceomyces palustris]